MADRRPPMPVVPKGGACRWCATPILFPATHKRAGEPNPRRTWCSKSISPCVGEYKIAAFQGDMRKALLRRDRGRCADCGLTFRCGQWAADHKIPLWSVPHPVAMKDRHLYWGLENLQTLCGPCHKAKCAREAAERATIRGNLKAR